MRVRFRLIPLYSIHAGSRRACRRRLQVYICWTLLITLSIGHPDYGCFIAREKTLTNFDYDEQVMNVIPSGQRGEWLGRAYEVITTTILQTFPGAAT